MQSVSNFIYQGYQTLINPVEKIEINGLGAIFFVIPIINNIFLRINLLLVSAAALCTFSSLRNLTNFSKLRRQEYKRSKTLFPNDFKH